MRLRLNCSLFIVSVCILPVTRSQALTEGGFCMLYVIFYVLFEYVDCLFFFLNMLMFDVQTKLNTYGKNYIDCRCDCFDFVLIVSCKRV
jgi:hypothetical protein